MTCARCQALEEQVAYLESELGVVQQRDSHTRLRRALRLAPGPARVLDALLATPRVVSQAALEEALDNGTDRPSLIIVNVYIHLIRQALGGKTTIETFYGEGYRLTAEGRAKVAEAIARTA